MKKRKHAKRPSLQLQTVKKRKHAKDPLQNLLNELGAVKETIGRILANLAAELAAEPEAHFGRDMGLAFDCAANSIRHATGILQEWQIRAAKRAGKRVYELSVT